MKHTIPSHHRGYGAFSALLAALLVAMAGPGHAAPDASALLGSFETDADAGRWAASGCQAGRVAEHATEGAFALRVSFPGSDRDTWPGVRFPLAPPANWSAFAAVRVDVFNAQAKAVDLAMRVDDAAGANSFVFVSVPSGKQTMDFGLNAGEIDLSRVASILTYRSKPREEATLLFDRFRLVTRAEMMAELRAKYTELRLVDSTPPPQPTAADRKRGYVPFTRSYLDLVYPASVPRAHEIGRPVEAFATPGEFEPLTFAVWALRDLDLSVSCAGLRGPKGARIPADCLDVRSERSLDKRTTYPASEYIHVPLLLESRDRVRVAQGTSRRFWVTVRVPESAAPGIYEGQATLRSGGSAEAIPLRLRVLPFRLEEPKGVAFGMYYRGQGAKDEAALLADLEDMRRHGMNTVGLCFGMDSTKISLAGGKPQIGWDGTSRFEQFIAGYRKLDYPEPLLLLSDSAQDVAAGTKADPHSEQYARAYQDAVRAITAFGKEKGWPEILWQPVDEPVWQSPAAMECCVRHLKLLKAAGVRTETDGPGDAFMEQTAGPFSDFWNYNGTLPAAEMMGQIHARGAKAWYYNNDVEGYRPEVMRYGAGFLLAKTGADGIYNWEYRGQSGSSMYDDLDSPNADFIYSFLPQGEETGGPAPSWEAFREGVDDYRYVALLKKMIAQARASARPAAQRSAEDAARALDAALAPLRFSGRLRGTAEWARAGHDARGRRTLEGPMKVPNGWDFDDYDRVRWQVASLILDLRDALGSSGGGGAKASGRAPAPRAAAKATPVTARFYEPPASSPAAAARARRELAVSPTAQPPAIDGRLDDPCWATAALADGFRLNDSGALAGQQTTARVTCDDRNLYLGIECLEATPARMKAAVLKDGGSVWEDDCVEVFLDTRHDRATCYQVVANSRGVNWSGAHCIAASWKPQVVSATMVGSDRWFAEIAIPLRDLDARSPVWGFNIGRERQPEPKELSTWSGLQGGFQQPAEFGSLVFAGSHFRRVDLGAGLWGSNTAKVRVRNAGPTAGRFRVRASVVGAPVATAGELALAPGAEQDVTLAYRLRRAGRDARVRLALLDAGGKEVARYERTIPVPAPMQARLPRALFYTSDAHVPVEVSLPVNPAMLAGLRLRVEVLAGTKPAFAPVEVASPAGRRGLLLISSSGLGAGAFTVRVTLLGNDRAVAARCELPFRRIPGPFGDTLSMR